MNLDDSAQSIRHQAQQIDELARKYNLSRGGSHSSEIPGGDGGDRRDPPNLERRGDDRRDFHYPHQEGRRGENDIAGALLEGIMITLFGDLGQFSAGNGDFLVIFCYDYFSALGASQNRHYILPIFCENIFQIIPNMDH
jgi:hypothetical protein